MLSRPCYLSPQGTCQTGTERQSVADCKSSHDSLPFPVSMSSVTGPCSSSRHGVKSIFPCLDLGLALPLWRSDGVPGLSLDLLCLLGPP